MMPGRPHGHLHHTRAFGVPGLPGTRACTVYLPPGYDPAGAQRYPVAYMFDGQNLFGDAGSYAGGWHLHRLLDGRASQGKPVPIVVGIHHGGLHRAEDLSPWRVGRRHHGRADALLDWIVGTLRRYVQEDLRALSGPEHTLLGGSSLGGLAALYGWLRHPEVFGRVLAMSPSCWVNREELHRLALQGRWPSLARVYLDAGGREMGGQVLRDGAHLAALLAARGLSPAARQLLWRPDQRGSHNERAWRRRLPKALRFLYDGALR
ncbi:MAG: alpha/beta hydrolase-fold protein [Candidatus Sericytochromatia bacterium]|nr:alpha/beta hydrolase-fold protein [Candidatus Sericytochromatia bacterium]